MDNYYIISKILFFISNKHLNIVINILFKMVNEKINIRDKKRGLKRVLKILIGVFVVILIGLIIYFAYLGFSSNSGNKIVLENPLSNLVLKYASFNNGGVVEITGEQQEEIIQDAILEFDANYINYILLALGVGGLHKSPTFENPKIELDVGEIWSSEIIKGSPQTKRGEIDGEDVRFIMSKEEAVKALLSNDIGVFMKDSVGSGRTQIEMIAGKVELFSKGYLSLYKDLTGQEAPI